jgi:hypothetical protein
MNDEHQTWRPRWAIPGRSVGTCAALGLVLGLLLAPALQASGLAKPANHPLHGLTYRRDDVPDVPWSIHIVKVLRANPEFELQTALAGGSCLGVATLSEQVKELPADLGRPVAAVNGDFFKRDTPYLGDPKGLQILRGELVSAPCDWACFWVDPEGSPHMTNVLSRFEVVWPTGEKTPFGLNEERARNSAVLYTAAVGPATQTSGGRELVLERNGTNQWLPLRPSVTYSARVREVHDSGNAPVSRETLVLSLGRQLANQIPAVSPGTILQISTAMWPELKGVQTALGGGPPLVRAGKINERVEGRVRHPRTALGWNKDYYFLVEVDGRQRDLSVGMTLRELANYMAKLGCTEALNLDGGGSATCWVYGQVMNSPSEGQERGMGNALVVVQKEKN